MAFIHLALSLIALGIIYGKMIRREVPAPVSKAQAIVPVLLGAVSVFLSFACVLGIASFMGAIGANVSGLPDIPRSLFASFCLAGFPEELGRMLVILLALFIFRGRIKNAYEIILIGAGAGFGFTLFEEFLYASDSIFVMIIRMVTLAGHMAFGMIMAGYLARARSSQRTGSGSVWGNRIKALLVPVCIHTVYDACTINNRLMDSSDETTMVIGLVLGFGSMAALFLLQIRVLAHFKKNAERYCDTAV